MLNFFSFRNTPKKATEVQILEAYLCAIQDRNCTRPVDLEVR